MTSPAASGGLGGDGPGRQAPASRWFAPSRPVVRQYDETDCGPAALLSVLRFWGGSSTLPRVRELAHTDPTGTTLSGLAAAARALGLTARGVTGDYQELGRERLPCIAHVVLPDRLHHYVVVYEMDAAGVVVGDPAQGVLRWTRDQFVQSWTGVALLLEPTRTLVSERPARWLPWLWAYLRQEETWLYQSAFLGLVYTTLSLAGAVFVRLIIDRFVPARSTGLLIDTGLVLLLLMLLRAAASYLRQRFLVQLHRRLSVRMTAEFLTHIFRLPARFFETRKTGDITARIGDALIIQGTVLRVLGTAVGDVLVVLGSLAFVFLVAPSLGWVVVAAAPLYAGVVLLTTRHIRAQQTDALTAYGQLQAAYVDGLSGIETVRGFNVWQAFATRTASLHGAFQLRIERLGLTRAHVSVFSELAGAVLVTAVLMFGAWLAMRQTLSIGTLMAAYAVLAGMLPSIDRLAEVRVSLQQAAVAAQRLFDLLLAEPERNPGRRRFALRSGLEVRGATFGWRPGEPLLEDLNLVIPRGRVTGLWGASGVGKSTLVKVLQRSYGLSAGQVLVDDVPFEEFDLADYRRNVVVVPESGKLFSETLIANLLLERADVDLRKLLDRLRAVGLDRFIDERFPEGLATMVGESGRQLSSGERQVITVLRALVDEPAVLIVDEGLNAVDPTVGRALYDLCERYAAEHAVLLVSHDLRALLRCQTVYVLERGRIAASGPPHELLGAGESSPVAPPHREHPVAAP